MKCPSPASERIQVRLPSFPQWVNPRPIKKKGGSHQERKARGQPESRVDLKHDLRRLTDNRRARQIVMWLNCVVFLFSLTTTKFDEMFVAS